VIVVVTGAATGIGRAICDRLLGDGARVIGAGGDEPEGRSLEEKWRSAGRPFRFEPLDVTAEADVAALFDGLDTLDSLVNCAGIYPAPERLEDVTLSQWRRVIDVNLTGTFLTCRAALPLLRRGGGSMVNISSVHAISAAPGQGAYAASKSGITALTRQIAVDYARDGIRANSVLVGSVDTRITRRAIAEAGSAESLGLSFDPTHLGRVATPAEIASVVAFLLSTQASFITGSALLADAGLTARIL
jgi:NAD(P)-dependent dehydrogenase (short-subunit alcohol dehydrogenase family)